MALVDLSYLSAFRR